MLILFNYEHSLIIGVKNKMNSENRSSSDLHCMTTWWAEHIQTDGWCLSISYLSFLLVQTNKSLIFFQVPFLPIFKFILSFCIIISNYGKIHKVPICIIVFSIDFMGFISFKLLSFLSNDIYLLNLSIYLSVNLFLSIYEPIYLFGSVNK